MLKRIVTSESVGAGHPDKICDQIADAILDQILRQDQNARVACEVMASNQLIVIGGEITTSGYVDVVDTAWKVLRVFGYKENDFIILANVNKQSPDISIGVDQANGTIGAGDQGTVFGYASNETKELMPLPIVIAHELVKRAEKLRREKQFKWAQADMKAQVTIEYCDRGPRIETVLMSIQHDADYDKAQFHNYIKNKIIRVVTSKYDLNSEFKVMINPTGKFVVGGPKGDTGLTGRKVIVDTYGSSARHGGGAFSGKDYTKIDRSGAYAARWVAKNLVAAQIARQVEVQISYAIGVSQPIAVGVNSFGTGCISDASIGKLINAVFDLSVAGIITSLDLKRPIYLQTATFGHFGRTDIKLPWEQTNKVAAIRNFIKTLPK